MNSELSAAALTTDVIYRAGCSDSDSTMTVKPLDSMRQS